MIDEVAADKVAGKRRSGPKIPKTIKAQQAVDEFLASDMDACKVDWREIDDDFQKARQAIAYRISYTRGYTKADGAEDLAMRSDAANEELFIIHSDKVEG